MQKYNGIKELGAGAGIGTLLGLIMGLSASPVVSTVLGAIAAGLFGLLGITERSSVQSDGGSVSSGSLRILGFGFLCSIFLVVGILLRTHDVLAPSIASQEKSLSASTTLSKAEIHQILLLKAFGLSETNDKENAGGLVPTNGRSVAATSSSVLFSAPTGACVVMKRDRYNDISGYLEALHAHGGEFAKLGEAISHAPAQDQESIASSMSDLLCN